MFLRHFCLEDNAAGRLFIFLNEMLENYVSELFLEKFLTFTKLLVCAPANQQTKWWQMTANLN